MRKILVATDGSEYSLKAAREAINLTKAMDAAITVLSAAQEIVIYGGMESAYIGNLDIEKAAEAALQKTESLFRQEGIPVKTKLVKGNPAEAILDTAEDGGFDLIVVGSRGLGGINRFLLGSVSSKVASASKVSVLIVK